MRWLLLMLGFVLWLMDNMMAGKKSSAVGG